MDIRAYLSRYHYLDIDIKHMQDEIEEYKRLANSIPSMSFDALRVDGTKSLDAPFTKWIHKAMEKELQIADLKKQLQVVKCEIISTIDKLADMELRKILIYRYIDWNNWNQIALKMHISYSTARRFHYKAIEKIQKLQHNY